MTLPEGWIALYPWWYAGERGRMRRRHPDFAVSELELEKGTLAFKGTLRVDLGNRAEDNHVLLVYDDETPYHIPLLFPLTALPEGDAWEVDDVLECHSRRMPPGYRRHQMASARSANGAGSLCVIEAGTGQTAESVSGVDVLSRAKEIFRSVALGHPFPFPDAEADDLEAHFPSSGDILIGEAFFDPARAGPGKFWGVTTMDEFLAMPTFVEQSTELPRRLYIGLHLSVDGAGIIAEWRTDRTLAMRRAFPFTGNARLSFEGQLAEGIKLPESATIEGQWYHLTHEPEPVTTGAELAALLQTQLGVADGVTELLRAFPRFGSEVELSWVGLRYPSRGELRWLFLGLLPQEVIGKRVLEQEGAGVRRDYLRQARVGVMRAHRIAKKDLELRNQGAVPTGLFETTVLVLGCGALGGDVAIALGKAGVKKLVLVDHDALTAGNVIRHAAGLPGVGLKKVDAVRQLVLQHNPFVEIETVPSSATHPRRTIDELLSRADLTVSTIADDNVEHVVNEAAVRLGKIVVYGRALRGGKVARVFRVRPGTDACLMCAALYGEAHQKGEMPNWIVVPADENELVTRECGQPVLAGSAVDLRIAADLTARALLDEIGGGIGWNTLLWIREPWANAPPRIAMPYAVVRETHAPRNDCPVCVRPRITGIELSGAAAADLRRYAEGKPTTETGGALIGYEENGVVHVLEVTDAGPAAEETPTRFRYDASHINALLTSAAARLGSRGLYVGEWHTHLEAAPVPSALDIASLSDIALAPNFLTDEPVMIIAGLNPETSRAESLHASSFPINRAMRLVPLNGWP